MHAAVFANGVIEDYTMISMRASLCQTIIAVDGGLEHCMNLGIMPDIVIGDMDSADAEVLQELSHVKQVKYPKEKDESDLELALDYCNLDLFEKVTIFGGLGGFLDHTLANLFLLPRYGKKLALASDNQTVILVEEGLNTITFPQGQPTFSVLPIYGPVFVQATKGLKWEMNGMKLDSTFVSLSNVCLQDEITIELSGNPGLGVFSNRSI